MCATIPPPTRESSRWGACDDDDEFTERVRVRRAALVSCHLPVTPRILAVNTRRRTKETAGESIDTTTTGWLVSGSRALCVKNKGSIPTYAPASLLAHTPLLCWPRRERERGSQSDPAPIQPLPIPPFDTKSGNTHAHTRATSTPPTRRRANFSKRRKKGSPCWDVLPDPTGNHRARAGPASHPSARIQDRASRRSFGSLQPTAERTWKPRAVYKESTFEGEGEKHSAAILPPRLKGRIEKGQETGGDRGNPRSGNLTKQSGSWGTKGSRGSRVLKEIHLEGIALTSGIR